MSAPGSVCLNRCFTLGPRKYSSSIERTMHRPMMPQRMKGQLRSNMYERSWPFIRWGIIGLCIVLSMELLYFLGPNVKQRFKHTLPGALIGTVLWILISAGVNVYVS